MKTRSIARGIVGSVAALLGVMAAGCSADVSDPQSGEAEIGSTEQAIAQASLTSLANNPIRYASSIRIGDEMYRFGGESAVGTFSNAIVKFDKSGNSGAGLWTTGLQTLSANRYLPGVAKIPGTNFVAIAGGASSSSRNADIDLYDVVNDTITTLSGVLTANFRPQITPCGLANSGAGGNGQKMLISLGDVSGGASKELVVLTFNATTPGSSTVAALQDDATPSAHTVRLKTARKSHNMIALDANNQKILVAVGNDGSGTRGDAELIEVNSSCQVANATVEDPLSTGFYQPKAAQISSLPSSAKRQDAALLKATPTVSSTTYEGLLFSGLDNSSATPDTTFLYDVQGKAWIAGPNLPTGYGRTFAPVDVSDSGIIGMAGGETSAGAVVGTFATYDSSTNAWTSGSALTTSRKGNVLAAVGSGTLAQTFLVFQGHDGTNFLTTVE